MITVQQQFTNTNASLRKQKNYRSFWHPQVQISSSQTSSEVSAEEERVLETQTLQIKIRKKSKSVKLKPNQKNQPRKSSSSSLFWLLREKKIIIIIIRIRKNILWILIRTHLSRSPFFDGEIEIFNYIYSTWAFSTWMGVQWQIVLGIYSAEVGVGSGMLPCGLNHGCVGFQPIALHRWAWWNWSANRALNICVNVEKWSADAWVYGVVAHIRYPLTQEFYSFFLFFFFLTVFNIQIQKSWQFVPH